MDSPTGDPAVSNSRSSENKRQHSIANYEIGKTLGMGSFGKVKLGTHCRTGEKVALKIIEKSKFTEANAKFQIKAVQREIKLLKLLNHPHVIRLYEVIETKTEVYVIMEYAPGGELFDYIVARKRLNEKEARKFFRQIMSALHYCHERQVVHRDLKPENLLLSKDLNIKIIDFGLGNTFRPTQNLETFCGSPAYAAPEMIQGKAYQGPAVDMWSLGVLLYALICGCLPFEGDDLHSLYRQILSGKYEQMKYLTPEIDSLLRMMLTVDPTKRATLKQVAEHPWVKKTYTSSPLTTQGVGGVVEVTSLEMIDESALEDAVQMGLTRDKLVKSLLANHHNQETITYYLLAERNAKKDQHQRKMRDLKSSLALPSSISRKIGSKPAPGNSPVQTAKSPAMSRRITPTGSPNISPSMSPGGRRRSRAASPSAPMDDDLPMFSPPPLDLDSNLSCITEHQPTLPALPVQQTEQDELRAAVLALKLPSLSTGNTKQSGVPQSAPSSPKHTAAHRGPSQTQPPSPEHTTETAAFTPPPRRRKFSLDAAAAALVHLKLKKKKEDDTVRTVQGIYSCSTTSGKKVDEVLDEVLRVLTEHRVAFNASKRNRFVLKAEKVVESSSVKFEIEVVRLPNLDLRGIIFKRYKGNTWHYKSLCQAILESLNL